METVYTCSDRIEAEIVVAKLDACGISAQIFADDCAGLENPLTAISGVKVVVSTKDKEAAEEILSAK